MAKFKVKGNNLYIDGEKVLRGWESWNGWYWFATEKSGKQLSDFGDGKPVPDTIWFGYVQGLEEEWGYFSQAEIESLKPKTWEIPKKNLPYSGRRKY
ncbi:MAG: hypothetical protein ACTSRL_21730 [Candidatus Helarchaeota archaeon]